LEFEAEISKHGLFSQNLGRQVWKSTGLRDRNAALAIARQWDEEARRKRAAQGAVPTKPTIRVGSAEKELGLFSQKEVAAILRISVRAVRDIERRAFYKLRRHPALQRFWREWLSGELGEAAAISAGGWELTQAEIAALYSLTQTPLEGQALGKLIALAA